MKLLMISTDRKIFEKGSAVAQRQVEYAKKYEEVHIIIFSDKTFTESTIGSNIWVYPTRSSSKLFYIFDALKLGKFIAQKRNITHITSQDPFETGLVGVLIKNKYKAELELQIHTDIGSPYFQNFTFLNRIRTLISKYTLRKADHVRVVSERIKKYVAKYIDESKIEIRPIAIDIEKIANQSTHIDLRQRYPHFSRIILMASRLEREKNIDMALLAFKIVADKIPGIGLVIVGKGSEEKRLAKLVIELGIEKSVIFEGWKDDLSSHYKTCDVFLVSSWYEGYGMTLVEAKSSGARIVSTDVGVAREMGAVIVGFSPEKIAYGILSL